MSAGPIPLRYVEEAGSRRGGDRRATDRRAPRRWLDPLFAATLVNQVAPAETQYARGYAAPKSKLRAGIVVNVRA
jgi:hypothetical protein